MMRTALVLVVCACTPEPPVQAPLPQPARMRVESPAIVDGLWQQAHGCQEESPAISWSPGPAGTDSYAIRVLTLAEGHPLSPAWLATGIPADSVGVHAGVRATEYPPVQSINGKGSVGWRFPCDLPDSASVEIAVFALGPVMLPPPTFQAPEWTERLEPAILAMGAVRAQGLEPRL